MTRRGQTMSEQALIIGTVVAAIIGMSSYIKRGIQAGVKVAADQMSDGIDPTMSGQERGLRYESGIRGGEPEKDGKVNWKDKDAKIDWTKPNTVLEQKSRSRTLTKNTLKVVDNPNGSRTKLFDSDPICTETVGQLDGDTLPQDVKCGQASKPDVRHLSSESRVVTNVP